MGVAGSHLARGERSLISAFQDASKKYQDRDLGILVPFNTFYESIESFIFSSIRSTIAKAKDNSRLSDDDAEILKVLFMIKYMEEIRPNLENITTLMVSNIDEDKLKLREKVSESLERLIKEKLVHRSADMYIFLTEEEQEVNNAISNIEIDEQETRGQLSNVIFGEIFSDNRISYDKYNAYYFKKMLDSTSISNIDHEIGLKIITPYNPEYDLGLEQLALKGIGQNILHVIFSNEQNYFFEIEELLKIQKYIKRSSSLKISESIKKIQDSKRDEVAPMQKRIKENIENEIINAGFYLNGAAINIKGSSAREKLQNGLIELVKNTYTKLDYIEIHCQNNDDIKQILYSNDIEALKLSEESANNLALNEVKQYLENQQYRGIKVNYKAIIDNFSKVPYGWSEYDIYGLVATLFVNRTANLKINEELVDRNDKNILDYLTKKPNFDRLIVNLKHEPPEELKRKVKNLFFKVYGEVNLPNDSEKLANTTKEILKKIYDKLKDFERKAELNKYPGKDILENYCFSLDLIINVNEDFGFFNNIIEREDELSELEKKVEPVRSFFESEQIKIFEEGRNKYKFYNDESAYLDEDSKSTLKKLNEIIENPEPYEFVKDIPLLLSNLKEFYNKKLSDRKDEALHRLEDTNKNISGLLESIKSNDFKSKINSVLNYLKSTIEDANNCSKIDATLFNLDNNAEQLIKKIKEQYKIENPGPEPPREYVSISRKNVISKQYTISTNIELDNLLDEIRKSIKAHLDSGKIIKIIE